MLTQGSSELWNCILVGLTILHRSTLYKLYVCLWKLAVWNISSFYFYMYLNNLYILFFFLIRRCCCYGNLLWKVNELSMFVKSAGNFLCSFFTIIITEKKRKNITTITAEWSVPNSFFWSHFNFISPLFQSRRKNEQWLNVD